ncbi:DUF6165 family protein [Singulisphaera rosea]
MSPSTKGMMERRRAVSTYERTASLRDLADNASSVPIMVASKNLEGGEAEALNDRGIALAQGNQLSEAIQCFQKAISINSRFASAHHNLGLAYGKSRRLADAIACFEETLRLQPNFPEAHNHLGIALGVMGRPKDAMAAFEQALWYRPDFAEARSNLANALLTQNLLDQAIDQFLILLKYWPNHSLSHNNLGNAWVRKGRTDNAASCFRRAVELDSKFYEAHYNLGYTLDKMGLNPEAEKYYRLAIAIKPDYAEAYYNLGNTISRMGRQDDAIECYREATRFKPNYADAYNNIGHLLAETDRHDQALPYFLKAIELEPKLVTAHNNAGLMLARSDRRVEADKYYLEAVRLDPEYADAHLNGALNQLTIGDFERGWSGYEWRWRVDDLSAPVFKQPAWEGEPLEGKTILLYSEQGLGDTLQFIRYAELIKARGGRVVVECQPSLIKLLSRCRGIDMLVPKGLPLPPFQLQCGLASLPRVFQTRVDNVPARIPYLFPDAALVAKWKEELDLVDAVRVGIHWQGSPHFKQDRYRSFPLHHFSILAEVDGVQLFSLQKNQGAEQVEEFAASYPLIDLGPRLDIENGGFMDTAAVLMNLDVLITCDTALGHLAGGLGVPVWIPTSKLPDWRWMEGRDDSPWYPNVRLFRQETLDDWEPVFRRMAQELDALFEPPATAEPITVPVSPGELADKITILELKAARFEDPEKLRNVRIELDALKLAYERAIPNHEIVGDVFLEIAQVNARLWDVEESLRACERAGEFGPRFVELARSVYQLNDRRAELKRHINQRLGSRWFEEKCYTP